MEPAALAALRARAQALRLRLDLADRIAEARLAVPGAVPRPLHTDWAWRPGPWSAPFRPGGLSHVASGTALGEGAKLFHDCPGSEIAVRQVRAPASAGPAPFGLRMDVFRFRGTFLSVAVDLPAEAVLGLTRRHIFRICLDVGTERPVAVFGRLNIRHGPNTEQVVQAFDIPEGPCHVDLDLAATRLDEDRVERAWIDIILDAPDMNHIRLDDVTLSRRPRAEV